MAFVIKSRRQADRNVFIAKPYRLRLANGAGADGGVGSRLRSTEQPLYSITSSARSRIDGGMARPSAVAVLRFAAISNLLAAERVVPPASRRCRSFSQMARRSLCN